MMRKKKSSLFISKAVLIANIVLGILFLFSFSQLFTVVGDKSNTAEVQKTAQQLAKECLSGQAPQDCYRTKFEDLIKSKNKDLVFSENVLYALQGLDPQLRQCHVLSHQIANAIERKNPGQWKNFLDVADLNTCGAGFFHGIIEAHVGDDSNFKITSQFIKDTCMKNGIDFRARTCAHILGHLLVLETRGDMKPGLPICQNLPDQLNEECYTGIFMEDSFKVMMVEHGLVQAPERNEPRMIEKTNRCYGYTGIAEVGCWIDLAEVFQEFYNSDAPKVYAACNQAHGDRAKERCYLKAVILMAVAPHFDTKEQLLSECVPYQNDSNKYKVCTDYIIQSLMHYSSGFIDRGLTLCNNITKEHKEYCYDALSHGLKLTISSKTVRERMCSGAPAEYKKLCVG